MRHSVMEREERPFAEVRRHLLDGVRIVRQHRWAFLLPFTAMTTSVFLLSLYYPRTYTASTTLERRNDPIMVDLPQTSGAVSFKYFRSTMERDLTSVAYVGEAIDRLGWTADLPRNADGSWTPEGEQRRNTMARTLAGTIAIQTTSPSEHVDIIRLTYAGPDPVGGARLLDEVKRTYIRRTVAWIHQFLQSQRDYFAQAVTDAAQELQAAQRVETRLRMENPHVNPQHPESITGRLEQLDIERRELQLRKREQEAELSGLRQMLAAMEAVPAPGAPHRAPMNPDAMRVLDQLLKNETELDALRTTRGMTDEHPEVRERLQAHRRLEAELARFSGMQATATNASADGEVSAHGKVAQMARPWNGEHSRLTVQLATQEAKMRDLDITIESNTRAIARLEEAKSSLFERQAEFADALAAVAKARQRHAELQHTLARVEPAIKAIEQDRLVQFEEGEPARGSLVPVSPKGTTIVILALLAGLAAGVVCVVVTEVMDQVYRSPTQVARSLGLPLLETIDLILTSQDRRRLLLRRSALVPVVLLSLAAVTCGSGALAYRSLAKPRPSHLFLPGLAEPATPQASRARYPGPTRMAATKAGNIKHHTEP